MDNKNFGKKDDVTPENSDRLETGTIRNQERDDLVHGTAGGEMPDPQKMPSKTDFHSDSKRRDIH